MSRNADVRGGGDVHSRCPRELLHQSDVPQSRAHTDRTRLHTTQLVDHALELNAFCCFLLAVLK